MRLTAFKRTLMASALAVATAVAGVAGQAQAFSFNDGDLVLAIYGNNTEAMYNLGNFATRLSPGATFSLDVSAGLTAAQVGANPVKYTLFGWDTTLSNGQLHAATAFEPTSIPTSGIQLTNQFNPSVNMAFQSIFTGDTIAKSDSKSFSSNLNTAGAGQFEGAWTVAMQGNLDQILHIVRGNVETNEFSRVGGIQLLANGMVTLGNPGPAAIPLPAGVVLFGTGLVSLVGFARRSFNNRMAA